jgi:YidC/Oxa1 family membrane protein insertase
LDRETIIRSILAAGIILALVWGYQWWRLRQEEATGPEPPAEAPAEPAPETPAEPAPEPPAETPTEPAAEPPTQGASEGPTVEPPPESAPAAPALVAVGADPASEPVTLGSARYEENPFDLEAVVTSRGGALERLTLARHRFFKSVADRHKSDPNEREALDLVPPDTPFGAFTMPELRVRLAGASGWSAIDLSEVDWRLRRDGATKAVAEVDVRTAAGAPVLTVRKTFALTRTTGEPPEERTPVYDVGLSVAFVDASAAEAQRPEKVEYVLKGPPALPREGVRSDFRQVTAGVSTQAKFSVARLPAKEIKSEEDRPPGDPATMPISGEKLMWAGTVDKYFTVVAIPGCREDGTFEPAAEDTFLAGAMAFQYKDSPEETEWQAGVRLRTRELALAAGEPAVHEWLVYAGPKAQDLLTKPPYSEVRLAEIIVWTRCCDPCSGLLTPISKVMVRILEGLNGLVGNYGIAIIILVICLRAALHPVTRWSRKSMAKMQRIQPKIKAVQEQYKDDKKRLHEEMLKLQREEGFNPFSGCLPMFVQMPIWIALYGALLTSLQLRHAWFIPAAWLPEGSIFLQDLAQPDALIAWQEPFFLPGQDIFLVGAVIGWIQNMLGSEGITSFNILPLLMSISMYAQQRLTPQPTADPDQARQQKMMMSFMTVFLLLVLYSAPAGLTLYIFTSMLLGSVESWYLRKKFNPPAAGAGSGKPAGPEPPAPKKKGSYVSGKPRSFAERIRQRIAPDADKGKSKKGKRRK